MRQPGRRRWLALGAAAILLLWLGGFVLFTRAVATLGPVEPPATDGIVVLTGDRERLVAAFNLLAEGGADRLLITGVDVKIGRRDLERAFPAAQALFRCCVDLGKEARNTRGNAAETARWARRRGYGSLTIVTTGYHMPRSLVELRRYMPGIGLVAYPVFPKRIKLAQWWRFPGTARILFIEYHKYLASRLRAALKPQVSDSTV